MGMTSADKGRRKLWALIGALAMLAGAATPLEPAVEGALVLSGGWHHSMGAVSGP
jgi:hypothetical protein